MLSRLVLSGIGFYQTDLSPRKGYRCAHSVLHGGTGCSGYMKHAIHDHGFSSALRMTKTRISECKDAAEELNKDKPPCKKRKKSGACGNWADSCGLAFCAPAPCSAAASPTENTGDGATCDGLDCVPDYTPSCDVCSCEG